MSASRFLARAAAVGALALTASVAGLAPASAQMFVRPFYYGGSWSGPVVPPGPGPSGRLSRGELFGEIADQGFRPLEVIGQGPENVVVDALDPRGRRVRLSVDAFDGEIMSRRLLAGAPMPGPQARPLPDEDAAPRPAPPRKRVVQSPKAAPAPANPDAMNPAGRNDGPVAPARDPSQWGKQG